MRFKQYYLLETPVAYDDETRAKIGKLDPESETIWGKAPSKNATNQEVQQWVNKAIKANILENNVLGSGASRYCMYNTGKTVFKYNNSSKEFGNQIVEEMKIYREFGSKFSDVLVKIYDSGKNWQIAEAAIISKEFDRNKFQSSTGCSWTEFNSFCSNISQEYLEASYKEHHDNMHDAIISVGNDTDIPVSNLAKSKILQRMLEFCILSGSYFGDLHMHNIGFRGNNPIIIDFGFTVNTPA